MYSQGLLFNDHSRYESSVVHRRQSPRIYTRAWQQACRTIGRLIMAVLNAAASAVYVRFGCLSREGKSDVRGTESIPLLSIGPSGIGGHYQTQRQG